MEVLLAPEAELEYRRNLLRLAAKGDSRAAKELEEEYHVRVYSAAERARYTPTGELPCLPARIRRKVDSALRARHDAQ